MSMNECTIEKSARVRRQMERLDVLEAILCSSFCNYWTGTTRRTEGNQMQ